MHALPLYIPWFQLHQWDVPLPYALGGLVALCVALAFVPKWREPAVSTATMAVVAGGVAYFMGVETVPIQPFGVLVLTGVLSASRLAEYQGKKWGVNPLVVADFATHIAVIGLISCYLLNGLFYETDKFLEVLANPKLFFSTWLGLSSFGGFVGAIFALWVWKKRRGLPALAVADIICWAFPLAWIFGRLGCFVVHDHPGTTTTFFLGVENWQGVTGEIRHDLGLYEVFWSIAVMALFWKLRTRQDKPTGFFIGLLPLLYTPYRFGLDFLRTADVRWAFGLTPGQYAAIGFFIFSLLWLRWIKTHDLVPEIPAIMAWPPPEKPETTREGDKDSASKKPKKKSSATSGAKAKSNSSKGKTKKKAAP